MDRALVRGLAWTGIVRWSSHLFTWGATILVARILTPGDFGIWAMAGVYLGVITLLTEFGLGAPVIMMRDLTGPQIAQLNGLALIMGVGAMILSVGVAWPIGVFFRSPQLPPVILAMSVIFVITAFRVVPGALLQKDLQFKALALLDGGRFIVQSISIVTFALLVFHYWSLVLGGLVSQTAWTFATVCLRPKSFAWPRMDAIRRPLRYSLQIMTARLSWYLYSRADFMVAGRMLGNAVLGSYSMAWNLASVPVEKVSTLVNSVAPGFFSSLQRDPAGLRRYLLTLTEGIAVIVFPAAFGMTLLADVFVPVVLGEKWLGAVLPLQILAAYTAARALSPVMMPLLNALGETRIVMWNNLLGLVLLPTAFVIGARWGAAGIAAAWLLAHPVLLIVLCKRTFRRIQLRPSSYLAALWPAVSSTTVMAGVILGLRLTFHPLSPAIRLATDIAAGGLAYLGMLFLIHSRRLSSFYGLVGSAWNES
jgi:PST family polysaccharide transporter